MRLEVGRVDHDRLPIRSLWRQPHHDPGKHAHVGVDSPDLSVGRVRGRTEEGGHDAPEEKIRARYKRGQPLIREAVLKADRGMVFDSSRLNTAPQQMLVFASGRLTKAAPTLPGWILTTYATDLMI